jgi:hypothetical protein
MKLTVDASVFARLWRYQLGRQACAPGMEPSFSAETLAVELG